MVTLNLCLFVSVNYLLFENTIFQVSEIGRTEFTIPYIDGAVSISRTARTYPTYLIFKPAMIITAIILIKYWIANNKVIGIVNNEINKNHYFMIFGVGSALFLIAHSIFLGVKFDYDLYKFFRRFVLLGFIIFEVVAQTLLVISLFKMKGVISQIINKKILLCIFILLILTSLSLTQFGANLKRVFPFIETPDRFFLFNQPYWAAFFNTNSRIWEFLLGGIYALIKFNNYNKLLNF